MPDSLSQSIEAQRERLNILLGEQLAGFARELLRHMADREDLDLHLKSLFRVIEHCKYLWVLDQDGLQLSATVNRFGGDGEAVGRDRSTRPYMRHMTDPGIDFNLSEAYISRNKKRPSVTAVQTIRGDHGERLGFLGVDYDLRELPHTDVMYEEPSQWRQIKGDPAIRGGLFLQQRVDSMMDQHIDHVMSVHEALMIDQGVHHCQIHFSSSRSTIWHVDDPFVYRILTMEELANTNICLALPRRPYFERNVVPAARIPDILAQFRALRYEDETVYLRSGSLNLVNGNVGLNFSCDGTHYLRFDDFLSRGLEFWFGGDSFPASVVEAEPLNTNALDLHIETLAGSGCIDVNRLLQTMRQGGLPESLADFSPTEVSYIRNELENVMQVYDSRDTRN